MQTHPHHNDTPTTAHPLLTPGTGCLAAPGVWVLSLTGRAVRCIDPAAPAADQRAPSPLAVTAALETALGRMGAAPRQVVIGADVDPLLAGPDWSDAALAAAALLVDRGVGLRLCTRGAPGEGAQGAGWERLLRRAAASGGAVFETALFTLDLRLAALYEPGAPAPSARLAAATRLSEAGVVVEARVGPLVPWISDGAAALEGLTRALARAGVRRARAAYLHVDADHPARLGRLPPAQRALLRGCLGPAPVRPGEARLLPKVLRIQGHQRLDRIAAQAGLAVQVCHESNPDLPGAVPCLSALPEVPRRDAPAAGATARTLEGRPVAAPARSRRPRHRRAGTGGGASGQLALFR